MTLRTPSLQPAPLEEAKTGSRHPPSLQPQIFPSSPSEIFHGMGIFLVEEKIPSPTHQPLNNLLEPSSITKP